jgi:hypothetical protein
MSALIIGCMAPDFEYFARLGPHGGFGHTLRGAFIPDLPLALLVFWLFHSYAKEPMIAWLPDGIRRRLPLDPARQRIQNVREFALVLASILTGIATHLVWDSFTHDDYWPYRHWQFLRRTLQLPLAGKVEYVTLFQHLSTVVGFLVLAIWIRSWYRRTDPVRAQQAGNPGENQLWVLLAFCCVALLLGVMKSALFSGHRMGSHRVTFLLAEVGITSVTFLWLEIVGYGVLLARRRALPSAAMR